MLAIKCWKFPQNRRVVGTFCPSVAKKSHTTLRACERFVVFLACSIPLSEKRKRMVHDFWGLFKYLGFFFCMLSHDGVGISAIGGVRILWGRPPTLTSLSCLIHIHFRSCNKLYVYLTIATIRSYCTPFLTRFFKACAGFLFIKSGDCGMHVF